MSLEIILISVTSMVLILWAVLTYNHFILKKNRIFEAWSNIDVQLKKRYDLTPKLVDTVKQYMTHEKGVLESVTEKRNACSAIESDAPSKDVIHQENSLSSALGTLWALVEDYPELKAIDNFVRLQMELSDVENHIQLSRRYYNGAVRDFNILVESFPSNIIAKCFHFTIFEFFQIQNPMQRLTPKIGLTDNDSNTI